MYNYGPYDRPDIKRAREQNQRAVDRLQQRNEALYSQPSAQQPFNGVTVDTNWVKDFTEGQQEEADRRHDRYVRNLAETGRSRDHRPDQALVPEPGDP
ncbi:MAG: hypothetical protein LBI49_19515 [Nocardiopsaceae bacterium]|jgi:hypothetical protein|nr:hypothetical protein [Nocardiopsaceae bacterium]